MPILNGKGLLATGMANQVQTSTVAVEVFFKQQSWAKTFDECVSKHGVPKLFSYFQLVKHRKVTENFRWIRGNGKPIATG